jgi:hypothetical protein
MEKSVNYHTNSFSQADWGGSWGLEGGKWKLEGRDWRLENGNWRGWFFNGLNKK